MKKYIAIIIILFAVFSISAIPAYADYCDDIALSYQQTIQSVTNITSAELGRRGISAQSGLFQQTIDAALQPIMSEMNYKIADCKYQQALRDIPVNNPATSTPMPTQAPQIFQIIITATPQPTPTPKVIILMQTATPKITPAGVIYSTPRSASAIKETPILEVSPIATSSSNSIPTPITELPQQKLNIFQQISHFFQNILHSIFR